MRSLFAITFLILTINLYAQDTPLSITLDNYSYPYEVKYLPLSVDGKDVRMAYMDIIPSVNIKGRTVVLLHGKNFFGKYWEKVIPALTGAGYRVIVPDQIGFGKSSKEDLYYTFHMLAENTRKLLDTLGINDAAIVGHSMGGMLAARFTLLYPERVTHLIFENPIGLEDYKRFVPYEDTRKVYLGEMKQTEEDIRKYHQSYYVNPKPEYDEYVKVPARQKLSSDFPKLAWVNALTYQMIYTQPVVYEFSDIKAKTLVVIGQSDRTVVGKAKLPKEMLNKVGQYPELGRRTVSAIPGAKLVEIENVGHIPHFEATDRFNDELVNFLKE